jgi:UDP-sugar pyrophosphorylase
MNPAAELEALLSALPVPQPHLREVEDKAALLGELRGLDDVYPGGIAAYLVTARDLLAHSASSAADAAPVTALRPGPSIIAPRVIEDKEEYAYGEGAAEPLLRRTAFVLVAGGLGERLGYSGIKLELPTETASGLTYLKFFADWIRIVGGNNAPFVIMTSDDTHDLTTQVLARESYFGLRHIHLLKQETVPCLGDSNAALVLKSGTSHLLRKPHGHGDVHTLIHRAGLARKWRESGYEHIVFFQDTNAAMTLTVPQSLAAMFKHNLDMVFTCVPRQPGEAVGALCDAVNTDGVRRVQNVEYNIFDGAHAASAAANAAEAGQPTDYPGSVNTLLLNLTTYERALSATGGKVPEFINPKYKDATKSAFKSPTRVESLMQDIALVLPADAKISGVTFGVDMYCPVKNQLSDGVARGVAGQSTHCAASGEEAVYEQRRQLLIAHGVKIQRDDSLQVLVHGKLPVNLFPIVAYDPAFLPFAYHTIFRLPAPQQVALTPRSALVVEGDVVIESLELDGALHLRAVKGQKLVVRHLKVSNRGWTVERCDEAPDELTRIRGYRLQRHETECYEATGEDTHDKIVDDTATAGARSNI